MAACHKVIPLCSQGLEDLNKLSLFRKSYVHLTCLGYTELLQCIHGMLKWGTQVRTWQLLSHSVTLSACQPGVSWSCFPCYSLLLNNNKFIYTISHSILLCKTCSNLSVIQKKRGKFYLSIYIFEQFVQNLLKWYNNKMFLFIFFQNHSFLLKPQAIWRILERCWNMWSMHVKICVPFSLNDSLLIAWAHMQCEGQQLNTKNLKKIWLHHWKELHVMQEPYVGDHLSEVNTIWAQYKMCIWKVRVEYYNIF